MLLPGPHSTGPWGGSEAARPTSPAVSSEEQGWSPGAQLSSPEMEGVLDIDPC